MRVSQSVEAIGYRRPGVSNKLLWDAAARYGEGKGSRGGEVRESAPPLRCFMPRINSDGKTDIIGTRTQIDLFHERKKINLDVKTFFSWMICSTKRKLSTERHLQAAQPDVTNTVLTPAVRLFPHFGAIAGFILPSITILSNLSAERIISQRFQLPGSIIYQNCRTSAAMKWLFIALRWLRVTRYADELMLFAIFWRY